VTGYVTFCESINSDGLVKSPSAALRFNFVVAVPEEQSSQGPHSSVFARLASGAFYETIVLPTFYEIIKSKSDREGGGPLFFASFPIFLPPLRSCCKGLAVAGAKKSRSLGKN